MVDNKKGFDKLMKLCEDLEANNIDLVSFIDDFERVCFNDISSSAMDNFADGWTKACVSSLMKLFIKARNGDEKALSRIKVDLYIEECNFTIKKMD